MSCGQLLKNCTKVSCKEAHAKAEALWCEAVGRQEDGGIFPGSETAPLSVGPQGPEDGEHHPKCSAKKLRPTTVDISTKAGYRASTICRPRGAASSGTGAHTVPPHGSRGEP